MKPTHKCLDCGCPTNIPQNPDWKTPLVTSLAQAAEMERNGANHEVVMDSTWKAIEKALRREKHAELLALLKTQPETTWTTHVLTSTTSALIVGRHLLPDLRPLFTHFAQLPNVKNDPSLAEFVSRKIEVVERMAHGHTCNCLQHKKKSSLWGRIKTLLTPDHVR